MERRTQVQRLVGSAAFDVEPLPATPVVISPGEEVDFTVTYTPSAPGATDIATIRITSNDPNAPFVDLLATATTGAAHADLAIADSGDFGDVCLGDFLDRDLAINNAGNCLLEVTGLLSSAAEFMVPAVVSLPLHISPGASIGIPLRFEPSGFGSVAATISVLSNDPAGPAQIDVEGTAPPPRLVLSIADSGDFGAVCVGDFHDLPLTLSNGGCCPLTITAISSSSPEFLVPDVGVFPMRIDAGSSANVSLRFEPMSFGTKNATITVTSDDPLSPATLRVSGTVPSGKLAVTGTTHFGAVELGHRALQSISICNVGHCDLEVTTVGFKPLSPCDKFRHQCHSCGGCGCGCGSGCREGSNDDTGPYDTRRHKDCHCDQKCLNFKILTNPFPATIQPGSCLDVLIQYVPTCDNAACCELVIESNDPDNSSYTLLVTGHLRRTLQSALKCWLGQQLHELLEAGKGCA